jgi:hypothetical protein
MKPPLSAHLYGQLIECGNIIVDPSWLLDSVENGALMCEDDYMGFEPVPDDHHAFAASSDRTSLGTEDEVDKEAGEFLLEAILRLCRQDKQMSWPDIYAWCAGNVCMFSPHLFLLYCALFIINLSPQHDTKNAVEYWRSLNSPGYAVHAAAVALRQELRDAPRDVNDDLGTLLGSAREVYPCRSALPARSTSRASNIKPGKLETSSCQQTCTFADRIAKLPNPHRRTR